MDDTRPAPPAGANGNERLTVRQRLYEARVPLWVLPRGKTRWLDLVTGLLDIAPYGFLRPLRVGDYTLFLDPADANDLHYYFQRVGAGYRFLMARLLRSGDCVIDVGVNVGYFAAICAAHVGRSGAVHAVEASPFMVERLRRTLALVPDGPIRLHHAAAWHTAGTVTFNVASNSGWSSLRENSTFETRQSVRVDAIALDDFLRDHALDHVRVLKLDIEGAETDALLGARHALASGAIDHVFFEVEPTRLRAFGHTGQELADLMSAHGYLPVCIVDRDRVIPVAEDRSIPGAFNCDYLYARRAVHAEALAAVFDGR